MKDKQKIYIIGAVVRNILIVIGAIITKDINYVALISLITFTDIFPMMLLGE